ncbi:beta-galactosidase-1-like protein 2 isoform X1 [Bos taurus]|uniref:beta-galactosidase-1-like protein 2 isoform X1 n=2 Tax=Bos taurus TaxID=9913 RepID=UPI000D53B133|nr:beta-galactosidase-1-like protein 2 isoform X1 [Bos taurus]
MSPGLRGAPAGPEVQERTILLSEPRAGMMQAFLFLVRLAGLLSLTSRFLVTSALQEGLPESVVEALLRPSHVSERLVGLQVRGSNFTLGNMPFLILSGTIHYFRVPRDYWKDSLLKLKACGFNTVTTHVPWNLHEPRRGQFHYSGNLDLIAFISLASEVDLWVILCVGPYIGSDLDLGGLPSWLLKDSHMKLRTTHKGFTAAVNRYFDDLIPKIRGFQFQEEGPIIAMQMENEYGSYNLDKRYMPYIKNALLSRGIKTMLMTADTGQGLLKGHTPTVFATLHMKSIRQKTYEHLSSAQGPGPVMMTVYTARSLDGWGTPRNTLDLHMLMESVREMLKLRFSLNFYMFHGGTNFGFTGGAAFPGHRLPMVTSYDYGALLTEDGGYTPEYLVFQEFFRPDAGVPSFQHQDHRPKDTYAPLAAGHFISLWDTLIHQDDEPVRSTGPLSMEQLSVNEGSGQSAGYILYETVITRGGILNSDGHVKDRGQVFLDDKYIGVLDDTHQKLTLPSDHYKEFLTLRILVENQGRLASGTSMNQERKGLTGNIYLNGSPLRKFKIYSLEMQNKFIQRKLPNIWKPSFLHTVGPAFFLALLRVGSQPKDTFMSLQGWTKGVVFINGQNLGRYWNVGPQETLYVPGPWLKPGLNEIIVFEEFKSTLLIYFTNTSQLGY